MSKKRIVTVSLPMDLYEFAKEYTDQKYIGVSTLLVQLLAKFKKESEEVKDE